MRLMFILILRKISNLFRCIGELYLIAAWLDMIILTKKCDWELIVTFDIQS